MTNGVAKLYDRLDPNGTSCRVVAGVGSLSFWDAEKAEAVRRLMAEQERQKS